MPGKRIDEDELRKLADQGMNADDIAKELGCSQSAAYNHLKAYQLLKVDEDTEDTEESEDEEDAPTEVRTFLIEIDALLDDILPVVYMSKDQLKGFMETLQTKLATEIGFEAMRMIANDERQKNEDD